MSLTSFIARLHKILFAFSIVVVVGTAEARCKSFNWNIYSEEIRFTMIIMYIVHIAGGLVTIRYTPLRIHTTLNA